MKKITFLTLSLILFQVSFGQLTGVKTIPGDYATISAAVTDLNSSGVGAGGVTFNVAAGYTESVTTPILVTATGTAANPIVFKKSGSGANPAITRTDAGGNTTSVLGGQGDAVIIIQGSDYITFNGIDAAAGDEGIEYGYYLLKAGPTDGCKNVTITNCAITMTKGTSAYVAGIYASNNDGSSLVSSSAGITVTSTGGRHENVTLTGNTISNVFTGILLIGYNHTSSPYNFYDQNFVIGASGAGNVIQNFAGNSTNMSYGVYLLYHTSPSISYNNISNTAGGGADATGQIYGIFMNTSGSGGDFVANNNTITLGESGIYPATAISNGQTSTSVTINNNIFSYGTFASTVASYCIKLGGNTNSITVTGNTTSGSINKTGVGYFYGYYYTGSPTGGTANISNNTFSNISLTGDSYFYGIYHSATTSQTELINNNTVTNVSTGSAYCCGILQAGGAAGSIVSGNTITNLSNGIDLYGIWLGAGSASVAITAANNIVSGLSSAGLGIVYGIDCNNGTANTISHNTIYDLACTFAGGAVNGINVSGGTTNYVDNNFISDLRTPVSTTLGVTGICLQYSSTTNNVFFNTVYLSGTSSGSGFGSAAIMATVPVDLRNNILVNLTIPTGTGKAVAFRRSATDLTNYSGNSNNNLFYAGTPSASNLIYYDGNSNIQTLAAFQAMVGPFREAASVTELPPFVNVATKPYNLHLQTNVPTQCESGGKIVSTPVAITTDRDGDARYPNAGYPQNGGFTASAPDIGADEFGGTGYAPLSGVMTIPGTYSTIAAAVYALNTRGVGSGGVTFNVAAGYAEYISNAITLMATGTAANPIVFQKSGNGANPVVTRTNPGSNATSILGGQGDALIIIQGSDYVTFNGIDVTTVFDGIEYGYYLCKASPTDGCKNVTITNCNITMTKGNSPYVVGIYASNNDVNSTVSSSAGITITSSGGRHENVTLTGNTISDVFTGILLIGYDHPSSPYNFYDQNFVVGASGAGNVIQNFAGNTTRSSAGIYLLYHHSPSICYNNISNTSGGGYNAHGSIYGIFIGSSFSGGDFVANNNAITLGESYGADATFIFNNQLNTSVTINNNTFSYGNFNSTTTSYCVYLGGNTNNITVTGNQTTGTINKTGVGDFYGYWSYSSPSGGTANISNNNFSNISLTGTSTFVGIYHFASTTTQTEVINNNTIANISGGTGVIYGIQQGGGGSGSTVSGNRISNFSNSQSIYGICLGSGAGPTAITAATNIISGFSMSGSGTVYGLYSSLGTATTLSYNTIYDLTGSHFAGVVNGICINGGTANYLYNNFISDLRTPASTSLGVTGINLQAGTSNRVYFNTIYLGGTSSGSNFGSAAISAAAQCDLRNNIFVNMSTPTGTGKAVAFQRAATDLTNYAATSNNNLFYAGTPTSANLIFYDGTNSDPTLASYKARVGPFRDAASVTELPPFVNVSTTPYDLHLQPNVPTQCESGGKVVSTPVAIITDFDVDARYPNTGYPQNGGFSATAPDIGADEFGGTGYAPLAGVITIPGGYPTIAAAVYALNTRGVGSGGVTFNVAAGYTENITNAIPLMATGTAANPVVFQKSGNGANPIVTRTDAGSIATTLLGGQGDAVIIIQGSDNVTFNGIDVAASDQGIEYGYYLLKAGPADGCKNVTITNCAITMTKGTSAYVAGIYSSNNDATSAVSTSDGITLTSTGGRHENVTLTGNTISNVTAGIVLIGYNHSSPYTFYDQNFVIGASGAGNTIQNFGVNNTSTSLGIFLQCITSPTISYNTINNTAGGGSNSTYNLYGILVNNSNAGGDFVANNNVITLGLSGPNTASCIVTGPTCTSVTINNNTFVYGTFTATTTSYCIKVGGNTNNITVTGNHTTGTINKTGVGDFYGYYFAGSPTGGTANISNNTFSNITLAGSSNFNGIYHSGKTPQIEQINNNTVANISTGIGLIGGIQQGGGAAGSTVSGNSISNISNSNGIQGILIGSSTGPVSMTVSNNIISGLNSAGSGTVSGINILLGTTTTISHNTIFDLSGSNANSVVYGIFINGGTTNYLYNNFISDLRTPFSTSSLGALGIVLQYGTTNNVFFNTVYLDGTSSGSNFGSAAIWASSIQVVDLRNNILINLTTPTGTGKAVAFQRPVASLANYAPTSNNNLFYAGTPSSVNLIYYDGTNSDQTLASYQSRVGPFRDAASVTELPPFVNVATRPYDLHLQTNIPTQCESGGKVVSTPVAITTDLDGDARYPNTGYPQNVGFTASAPDIGADEFGGSGYAPLAGVITIPEGYPTIAAAVYALNTRGVGSGGVTFNVAAGYTENITAVIPLMATGTAVNPIVFQKSGSGANPVVTRTDAGSYATSAFGGQGDAVIIIQGSDYVTFNGIDVAASDQGIEYGYYLLKAGPADGCKNVMITNCAVTMTKGSSAYVAGIYASNNDAGSATGSSAGITLTSTGGRHENVTLTGNTISNVATGILLIGYNHTSSPYNYYDQNFVIGASGAGNTIQNFGGGVASNSYGVYLIYHTNPNVSYNTINNTAGGGSNATYTLYGIYMSTSSAGGDFVANNNAITLGQSSTYQASCIVNFQTCTSVTINNNTFGYGAFASTSSSYLIALGGSTNNITVTGNQTTGTINKTGAGDFYCYFFFTPSTSGTANLSNNTFSNITLTGSSNFYGFYHNASTSQTELINNNTVSNISAGTGSVYGIMQGGGAAGSTVNGNSISNFSSGQYNSGIYVGVTAPVALTVSNNIISGLSNTGSNPLTGIYCQNGTAMTFSNNAIYNLAGSNASSQVMGIYIPAGTTNTIANNFISDLRAPASTMVGVSGIYFIGGTTNNVFFNTIYLDGTSSGSGFGSAAIYTWGPCDLRNNILVNMTTPTGTGKAVAFKRTVTDLTNYAATSNNNLFYAGTPSSAHLIYYDGSNSYQTLAAFQNLAGPTRDAASVTELPPFVNVATKPYDLHLKTNVATRCESGGKVVSTPVAITTDKDGDARYPNAGYPQNAGFSATAPDIGADEFGGLSGAAMVFNVTGGGTYCAGGTGMTAGLSGSQAGASYQLYKDAVAYGSSVSGTGSALSWTSLPAGTYTIKATYLTQAWMTGNAVITMLPAFTAGTATGTQSVCFNTAPSALTSADATGGSGPYTYQWQVNNGSWSDISGATTLSYTPGALTATTQYLLQFTDTGTPSCGQVAGNTVTITVYGNLTAGISGGTSPICYNTAPGTMTASGSGGTGSYTFQWYTTDGIISGATDAAYAPGNLTATTGYYCAVTSGSCGSVNSTTTTITVYGNMTGIKTIPGDFATLASAVAMLNNCGPGPGGVTFNVAAGYTETITTPILLTATGTLSNPIEFQKSGGGANPKVTRTDAGSYYTMVPGGQGDGVIIIQGSDYVTFNGIDVAATDMRIEYGYYLRKASSTDGCKNVTITNSTITMTRGTNPDVAGIYVSNNDAASLVSSRAGITLTSTGGRHENITLTGNTISNVFSGILLIGYHHTSSPYDYYDQNFVVGASGAGNVIQNFAGNASDSAYGVYAIYHTSPAISYNTINNAAGGGDIMPGSGNGDAIGPVFGIYISTSSAGGDFVANNNAITLGQFSPSEASAIVNRQPGTSATVSNNTFSYGTFGSTAESYCINLNAATNNVTVTGNQTTGTINKTGAGNFYGYFNNALSNGGTASISNNTFSNISLTGASAFSGIYHLATNLQLELINNNTVKNISGGTAGIAGISQGGGAAGSTVSGNSISNFTNSSALLGISLGNGVAPVSITAANNIISGLSSSGAGQIIGITTYYGTVTTISHNAIYNLASSIATCNIYGITINHGTTHYLDNNFISDLRNPVSTYLNVRGIYITAGTTNSVFFNTVYLSGTSSGSGFGSAAIWASAPCDLRNNILINLATPTGTGKSVAFRLGTTDLTNYASTSNNNLFYAGTPSANNLIYSDGTNSDQTLADFQSRVGPTRDAASVTELPPFVNVATTPYDLHLKTNVPTKCESGGTVVSTPVAITTDFDGDARYPNAGYPQNAGFTASAPDIGADEFGGIAQSTLVFNVTGGGTYCAGGTGMSVGLSGSQTGASYQLFQDAVAYGSPVDGTGSALSWTSLPAGTYTIQATLSGNSSWMSGNAVIAMQSALTAGTAAGTQTICYNTVPSVLTSSDATGGSGPYTYLWQINNGSWSAITGATTLSYTPGALASTTQYRLQFTDAGTPSCGQVTGNTITVTVYGNFAAGATATTGETISYNGNPGIIGNSSAAGGGDGTISYKWQSSADDGFSSPTDIVNNASSYDPPPGLTASTWYRRMAKDGTCAGWTASTGTWQVTVISNLSPGAILTTGETVCMNGNPGVIGNAVNASGGTAPITYKWQSSANAGFSSPADIVNNATSYDPPSGLTVTTWYRRLAKDAGINSDWVISSGVWQVAVLSQLVAGSVSPNQNVCTNGLPALITAAGPNGGSIPYTGQWQCSSDNVNFTDITGVTGTGYQAGALSQTRYYRQVQTSTLGCGTVSTAAVTVTVSPNQITASATLNPVCPGAATTIFASGGYGYSWDQGQGPGSSKVVSPVTATSYTVTGTSNNGCAGGFATIIVNVTSLPVVVINGSAYGSTPASSTIAPGASENLTASGAASFVWNNGTTSNPLTVSPTATTTYSVTGTTDGCSATASHTVIVSGVSVGPNQTICPGTSATLTAYSNGIPSPSYLWTPGNLTGATVIVTPASTTIYTVTVNGSLTSSVTVTVRPKPVVNAGPDVSIAAASTVSLNASVTFLTVAPYAYAWSTTGGSIVSGGATPTLTVGAAGTYSVMVTDANGCISSPDEAVVTLITSGYTVSGNVAYAFNTVNSQMHGVTLSLKQAGTVVYTTTTPPTGNGNYQFNGVASGSYTVCLSSSKPWGGVTSADIVLIQNHYKPVGAVPLIGIKRMAADVYANNSAAYVDVNDRDLINNRRLTPTGYSFATGDWVFTRLEDISAANGYPSGGSIKYANSAGYSDIVITVSGAAVTQDFRALCYGDVDASNTGTKDNENSVVNFNTSNGFDLSNFPNPFTGQTTFRYTTPMEGTLTVTIHTLLGVEVATLADPDDYAGIHTMIFRNNGLAAGVYLYTVKLATTDDVMLQTGKMVIVR